MFWIKIFEKHKRNENLKQEIIISTALHAFLFSALILIFSSKHMEKLSNDEESVINTVIVNSDLITKNFNDRTRKTSAKNVKVQSVIQTQNQIEKPYRNVKEKDSQKQIRENLSKTKEIMFNQINQKKPKKLNNSVIAKEKVEVKKIMKLKKKSEIRVPKRGDIIEKRKTEVSVEKTESGFAKNLATKTRRKNFVAEDVNDFLKKLVSNANTAENNSKIKINDKLFDTKDHNVAESSVSISDIKSFSEKIKMAIENQFYNAPLYTGKVCTLKINLAMDGTVLDVLSNGNDSELCKAALVATQKAKIPKPPSQEIYNIFKNVSIDFKP